MIECMLVSWLIAVASFHGAFRITKMEKKMKKNRAPKGEKQECGGKVQNADSVL